MRIATYNLLHGIDLRSGAVDLDAAAAAVAALDADVVAVQEMDRGLLRTGAVDQVERLAAALGCRGVFAPALLGDPDTRWKACPRPGGRLSDPGGAAYGVGLLSRVELFDVELVALPGGGDGQRGPKASPPRPGWDGEPRVALSASLRLDGASVRVTTTHLSYLPWRSVAQLRVAAAAAAVDGPALLIGDLNLPAWGAQLALAGTGWVHAGGPPTYPAQDPRLQVDQLLVRRLTVRGVRAGPSATSDHLPLIAEVSL